MKVTVLGCGTSFGVPRIGTDWGACDPEEPRNRRRRVSILVEGGGQRVLVDTGPDLRDQLIDADVGTVNAVIWTHDHADHCHGIDELRAVYVNLGHPVPCYARPHTAAVLKRRFDYVFEGKGGYPATATLSELPDRFALGDLHVSVVDQPHGDITSAGLRFDLNGRSLVYSTDCSQLTDDMEALFEGCDLWIVDALRERPHPSHAHLSLTLDWVARIRPGRTILTHMDNSMDYRSLLQTLPAGVEPAHDGMEIAL